MKCVPWQISRLLLAVIKNQLDIYYIYLELFVQQISYFICSYNPPYGTTMQAVIGFLKVDKLMYCVVFHSAHCCSSEQRLGFRLH